MQLRIRSIETVPIRVTLEKLYRGSHYKMPRRCTIITRIVTEEGIVGESYNADADEEQAEIMRIIHDELGTLVIGRDAVAYEQCWELMRRVTSTSCATRFAMQAMACVDSAIWDAIGKSVQMPLYRLWEGSATPCR